MKDSDTRDAWFQIDSPMRAPCAPLGSTWIPLQILGILKACLCRCAVGRGGTGAPSAKSYGYCQPLVGAAESNVSQESI